MQQEERQRGESTESTCVKSPGPRQVFREEKTHTKQQFLLPGALFTDFAA